MTADHVSGWARIEPILDAALDLAPGDRPAFLARVCGPDAGLRARVERMLAAGEDPESPLERSLAGAAGPLMADLEPERPAASLGDRIGPWRLVAELGRGGMGEVYRAERADGLFAQTAALKLVRRGRDHDPLLVRRFLAERRILATLAHPNIARLFDGGVTPAGLPWFAMEFVPGRALDRYCEDLHLDVGARLRLMEQVLDAVAYAHRRLVVHRDLKPGNILVGDDGQVKLLDFGIAKLLDDEDSPDPGITLAYGRVMTPEYAAPEQVKGEPVTTATDIYSLGTVLYQLITGRRAHRFEKRSAAEIERVVCTTNPEAPSVALRASGALRPGRGVSSDLDTLVLTALQKDPARRYASADAMLDDLRRLRAGRPLLARADSLGYRTKKFIGRHRLGVSAGAVVGLALAAGVVGTAWQARAARLEATRADRVKEFLVDLLHQADPDVTLGTTPTVRQLLDRGTRRVDSLMGSEPVVQAELYEVLGNTYAHLNLLAQADTLHRKGLAVVRRLYGPGSEQVLDQAMAVAWGLNDRGLYGDADSLLSRAIGDYRAARGPDGQALSDALDILATARKRLGRPLEAESLYRESLALQQRLTGPRDTITASRLSDLASLLSAQDRLAPAESALTAAQDIRRGVLPPLDLKFLVGESNLAMIRMKRGDLADADPRLRRAVAGLTRVEGPGGLNLARALDRLALLEALERHVTQAVIVGRRASAMFESTMGPEHPETFNSLSALASYQAASGNPRGAEAGARRAYEGLRDKMGDRHVLTLSAGQRLAAIQLDAGHWAAARVTASMVLAGVRSGFPRVPPGFAEVLAVDAALRAREGDAAGAERGFQEALAALAGGTRVDSLVFPGIAARYAGFLHSRASPGRPGVGRSAVHRG